MGPSRPAATDALEELPEASPEPADAPGSPYAARRALLRDLTLPTVPDLDIPQSPPGTPPPTLDALNRKFDNFLELKRTKGVHFNERLAQSAALRNPGLMDKLMGFVGIETRFDEADATDQYANALPRDLWDPSALPPWAYKGPLRKAQEKAHERPRGERVEFVAAADTAPVTGKRKSRFDA
ncbi:hypothetical protein GQ53DRAFT_99754 [Thozetella sp. PMI_491]|nr:hypothetical protein GQ53DRAFT_99754 [Thozetella sp. PMI_491]